MAVFLEDSASPNKSRTPLAWKSTRTWCAGFWRTILSQSPEEKVPSWLSATAEARDSLWSIDLFRCESILLKSFWVMVVMDVFTRRIVGFGVEPAHIDGISVCRMFNQARCDQTLHRKLNRFAAY
jgi:hypothetical protein